MERRYRRRRNPGYLTASEIGERYDFHPNTVGNWCREGLIRYTRGTRGEYLIKVSDLEDFFDEFYR